MPGNIIDIYRLKEKILSFNNILIVTHINPDPDTLGSALGLKWLCEKLNKKARIFCDNTVSERICGFFDITPELDKADIKSDEFDYIICVDAASENMLGRTLDKYKNNIDLVIDHHYTNSLYGRETYLDEKAAATGEIIFNLAKELNLEINAEFAKYIYCAVICDSGSFRYPSTTPETMRIAAELIETGFDFAKLNRLIYQNKSLEQVAIERLAYNSLKLYSDGRIAIINITRELKKEAGVEGTEIEGINDIPRIIRGVEVGVVIKEASDDKLENKDMREFRISLRSNDYLNVAEIAAQFGGGGHKRAAGCKFTAQPELINPAEYIEQSLVEKIEAAL
jgi:phosphoesterase RecJ-like protein